jgi:hypothetical protein
VWDPLPQVAPLLPAVRPIEAPPRQVAAKSDPAKSDTVKPEPAKSDAAKSEPSKPDAGEIKPPEIKPSTKKRRFYRRF